MLKAKDMRVGDASEAYGTNGTPNGWTDIIVTPMHIQTALTRPEFFRPVKRLGIRFNRTQIEWILLLWWWICGFITGGLLFLTC